MQHGGIFLTLTLCIRPAVPLKKKRKYSAALRKGVCPAVRVKPAVDVRVVCRLERIISVSCTAMFSRM